MALTAIQQVQLSMYTRGNNGNVKFNFTNKPIVTKHLHTQTLTNLKPLLPILKTHRPIKCLIRANKRSARGCCAIVMVNHITSTHSVGVQMEVAYAQKHNNVNVYAI